MSLACPVRCLVNLCLHCSSHFLFVSQIVFFFLSVSLTLLSTPAQFALLYLLYLYPLPLDQRFMEENVSVCHQHVVTTFLTSVQGASVGGLVNDRTPVSLQKTSAPFHSSRYGNERSHRLRAN